MGLLKGQLTLVFIYLYGKNCVYYVCDQF